MLSRVPFVRWIRPSPRALRLLRNPAFLGALFWTIVVGIAWAADCVLVNEKSGSVPFSAFGTSIASLRDINGDGATDLIIGAPGSLNSTFPVPGFVYVYSGADGSLLYELHGEALFDRFGESVAALDDQDGDGLPDLIVGAPDADSASDVPALDAGRVYVISGATGALIYSLDGATDGARFGRRAVAIGDVNGDGYADLAIGAPGDASSDGIRSGAVYVYQGGQPVPGLILRRWGGDDASDGFGAALAWIKSTDASSEEEELAVGAPGFDLVSSLGTLEDAGAVYLYSGASGSLLDRKDGDATSELLGTAVSALGDIDRDGRPDFVVGAPGLGPGSIFVFSGATGQLIYRRDGVVPGQEFGRAVAGIPDTTHDESSDIMVGSPGFSFGPLQPVGAASVHSGPTGMPLCQPTGGAPGDAFGAAVAGWMPTSNGRFFLAVGAPGADSGAPDTGAVRFYSVVPGPPPGTAIPRAFDYNDASSEATLEWEPLPPTCAGIDFAVYQGFLDRAGQGLMNHLPGTCTTGGATMITVPVPPMHPGTAFYWIATALAGNEEGSYGEGTTGMQHAPSVRPCRVYLNPQPCQ